MPQSFSAPFQSQPKNVSANPSKRLSLAVKELDKLIHRARQLGQLSDQAFPHDAPIDEKDPGNTILSTSRPAPTLDK